MIFFRSMMTAIIFGCLTLAPFAEAGRKPDIPDAATNAIGEFLKAINALSGGTKTLPSGDPFLEKVRARYEIPERVPVLSPRGGSSIVTFIYDSERLPVAENAWREIFPDDYAYLQTHHNLKAVYCLHEKEPLDLGDIVIAIMPESSTGKISVFFNNKRGTIDSAKISAGNSLFFVNSQYIVKPVGVKFQI
ncbi:MAG: hypothetical protein H6Q52_3260 [Deltaproteobacteria bacterium]|nr:hypothetical protein [Deltaproteobacteria bacterium]